MIRIVCRETDYTLTQVNGACHERVKTFDVEAHALEAWLHEFDARPEHSRPWVRRSIVAVEDLRAGETGGEG